MGVEKTPASTSGFARGQALLAAALLVFAAVLGIISRGDSVHVWDVRFGRWIQRWRGDFPEALYRIGDMLGTTSIAIVIVAVGLVLAVLAKHWRVAMFLVMAVVFRLIGTQIKPIFDSPRPGEEHLRLLEVFDGFGYPSGHSTTVATVATTAVLLGWHYLPRSPWRWSIATVVALMMVLVGWSRIWAGAHWPSDVLGGWAVGTAFTLLAWMVTARVSPATTKRRAAADSASGQGSAT